MRLCRSCDRTFEPSSRHLDCPACRARNSCTCGKPKQRGSHVCSACRDRSESRNGNWKGGITYHKKGYVMRRARGHPRTRPKSPYVFEHILVMEEVLGRYLLEGESVHHINGVKDDNRPDNLELWTRPHPGGIRVADAIAWAHEILSRYDSHPGSTNISNKAQTDVT